MKLVEIFTDGACKGNPGPGGWGALLRYGETEKKLNGYDADTTNNRMELTAVIEALAALHEPCQVHLTTDSQYVKNGMTKWLAGWKRKQWKTASGSPVKNKELWQALEKEVARHELEWFWVKGHSGHPENELADELANLAITTRGSLQDQA